MDHFVNKNYSGDTYQNILKFVNLEELNARMKGAKKKLYLEIKKIIKQNANSRFKSVSINVEE